MSDVGRSFRMDSPEILGHVWKLSGGQWATVILHGSEKVIYSHHAWDTWERAYEDAREGVLLVRWALEMA